MRFSVENVLADGTRPASLAGHTIKLSPDAYRALGGVLSASQSHEGRTAACSTSRKDIVS